VQREFEVQDRVRSVPNILLIQIKRFSGSRKSHVQVVPDLVLQLDGLEEERLELSGVVYHRGELLREGHYVAASLGADDRFWFYDDAKIVSPLGASVEEFGCSEVYMLVYTRKRGSWRYGPAVPVEAAVEESDGELSEISVEPGSLASTQSIGDVNAEELGSHGPQSPPARSPPCKRSRLAADEELPPVPGVEAFPGQGAVSGHSGHAVAVSGDSSSKPMRSLQRQGSVVFGHGLLVERMARGSGLQAIVEELAGELAAVHLTGNSNSSATSVLGRGGAEDVVFLLISHRGVVFAFSLK